MTGIINGTVFVSGIHMIPANTPLLVQYCDSNVSRLRRVSTENVYLCDI